MKVTLMFLIFSLIAPSCILAETFNYNTVVKLSGKLESASVKTPDGEPMTFPALRLDEPIDVVGDPDGTNLVPQNGAEFFHLVLDDEAMKKFEEMQDEDIMVTGTLFPSDSRGHQTPVMLDVQNIELKTHSQESPSAKSTSTAASTANEGKNRGSRIILFVVVALVVNLIASLILHSNGNLTIYRDYTDAALTFAGVISPLLVLLISSLADLQPGVTNFLVYFTAIIALILIFRSTYVHNSNFLFVIMALLAKLFVISLYILFIFGNKGAGSRRQGETDIAYDIRRAHDDLKSTIFFIIYTALFIFLTRAMTRYRYFAPLHEHLSLSFQKVPSEQMGLSGEMV